MTTERSERDPALVAFGAAVRDARERAGKRIVELAPELDVSVDHLRSIETGKDRASNALYWRIARALELDPTPVLREAS